MSNVKVNGDTKTSTYYGEGNYCLLAKIKKTMFARPNEVRITFRLISPGTSFKKNDYFLYVNTQDGNTIYSVSSLDKKIDIKCHVRQDANYIYIYTEKVETGYEIIFQILSSSNLSLSHVELVHYGIFTNTLLGDTEIIPSNYNVASNATFSYQNSWVDNGFTYIRTDGDMVYATIDIKNGTMTNFTIVISGLPSRETSEPSGLRFPGLYKDVDGSFKGCFLNLSRSGDLQIQSGTLPNNAELICNFAYKRKFEW